MMPRDVSRDVMCYGIPGPSSCSTREVRNDDVVQYVSRDVTLWYHGAARVLDEVGP